MTDLGEKFAYTVLPNASNTNIQTIYQCDVATEEGLQVFLNLFVLLSLA
jgi:hypothetical protein